MFRRQTVHVCVHVSLTCLAAGLSAAEGKDGRVKGRPAGKAGRPGLIHYKWEPSSCHVSWLLVPSGSLSRSISLSFSSSPSCRLWYGSRPLASTLWQGPNTNTPTRLRAHRCTVRTRAHNNTQTGIGTSPSLICLLHMFSTRVKILPERNAKAEAFTSGELNYLSDATFCFFNLTLTCIRACTEKPDWTLQTQHSGFGGKHIPPSVLILHCELME